MISIDSLEIKDIYSIKSGKIDLSGPYGLYLIYGIKDDDPTSSNGVGKSSVTEIINWVCFDETIKKLPACDIIRKGRKWGKAKLCLTINDSKYTIIKKRKKNTSTVKILENGKDISFKDASTNKKKIMRLLGMNFGLWSNTVMIGQGHSGVLFDGTDKDRKDLFIKLLNLGSLDVALDKVRAKLRGFKNKLEHYRGKLSGLNIIDLKPINISKTKKKIKSLKKKWEKYYKKYSKLSGGDKQVRNNRAKIIDRLNGANEEIKRLKRGIKIGICPLCGNELTDLKSVNLEIEKHRNIRRSEITEKVKANEALGAYGKLPHYNKKHKGLRSRIDLLERNVNRALVATKHNKKEESLRGSCEKSITKYEKLIKTYKKLEEIFGINGYRKYLIETAVSRITKEMNNILSIISDIRVRFFVKRTKFDMEVKIRGKVLNKKSISGGEKKLLSVVFNLSVVNVLVGRNVDNIFYDEILAELDESNSAQAVEMLSRMAENLSMRIFITTNQKSVVDSCRDFIKGRIRIQMDNGRSIVSREF